MYAVVRTGGKQHKVAVGDVVTVERLPGDVGEAVNLTPLLVVDGEQVSATGQDLTQFSVSAEIVEHVKGPKIRIHKFKNKTGQHTRQGHRQPLTRLRVTGIDGGKG